MLDLKEKKVIENGTFEEFLTVIKFSSNTDFLEKIYKVKNRFTKEEQKRNGQFFTITNPFNHNLFFEWISIINNFHNKTILEPFAGTNNIIDMLNELGYENNWECFDIDPKCCLLTKNDSYPVIQKDTLNNFPIISANNEIFEIAITNPPYLSKTSATRNKFDFPNTNFNDLYKLSLNIMLKNIKYVAAIIPESFLTQNLFHNRLYGVVSLTTKIFNDTECPVCLALFIPTEEKSKNNLMENDFKIFSNHITIGNFLEIKKFLELPKLNIDFKFNDRNGSIGLIGIDDSKSNSIKFVSGDKINSNNIKVSSRSISKISFNNIYNLDVKDIINKANEILNKERIETSDLFFTAFKGLRIDGKYRRRIDFKNAKRILTKAIEDLLNDRL